MIDSTRRLLATLLPAVDAGQSATDNAIFSLPASRGADYRFDLLVEQEEATLAAVRAGAARGEYFWYHPFEDWRYQEGTSALEHAFHAEVRLVLTHRTRIVQRRNLLTWSFACEYEDRGAWNPIYRHSVVRGMSAVPEIDGSERVYDSPPLIETGHD